MSFPVVIWLVVGQWECLRQKGVPGKRNILGSDSCKDPNFHFPGPLWGVDQRGVPKPSLLHQVGISDHLRGVWGESEQETAGLGGAEQWASAGEGEAWAGVSPPGKSPPGAVGRDFHVHAGVPPGRPRLRRTLRPPRGLRGFRGPGSLQRPWVHRQGGPREEGGLCSRGEAGDGRGTARSPGLDGAPGTALWAGTF